MLILCQAYGPMYDLSILDKMLQNISQKLFPDSFPCYMLKLVSWKTWKMGHAYILYLIFFFMKGLS